MEDNSVLKVTGNAKITTSGGTGLTSCYGIDAYSGCSINVGKDAELEARGVEYGIKQYLESIAVTAEGKVTVIGGDVGIASFGPLSVSGTGLTVTGATPISVLAPQNTINMADNAKLAIGNSGASVKDYNLTQSGKTKTHKWLFTGSYSILGDANYTGSDISVRVAGSSAVTLERVPVGSAPAIFAPARLYLSPGYAAASTGAFTVKGSPAPAVSIVSITGSGTGLTDKIKWNAGSKKLSIAKGLEVGDYRVSLRADNGSGAFSNYNYYITVAPVVNGFKAAPHNALTMRLDWKHDAFAIDYEVHMAYGAGRVFYKTFSLTDPVDPDIHEFAIAGGVATFHHKGMNPGDTRYYKVRAVGKNTTTGAAVYGPFSAVKSVKTSLSKVTGVKAVSSGFSTNIVTWNEVPLAESYSIYRADSSNGKYDVPIEEIGSWKPRVFEDFDIVAGKTYFYKIKAFTGGKELSSLSAAVKAPPKTNKMNALKVGSEKHDQVRIYTAGMAGADGYEFYRAESSNGVFTKVQDVNSIRGTGVFSVVDRGLTTGKTYYYKARAFKYSGTGMLYGGYSGVAKGNSAPGAVAGTAAASAGHDAVKVTWSKTDGASGYEVYKASALNGKYTKAGTLTGPAILEYTVKGLKPNTDAFFKVRAYAEADGKKTFGDYGSAVSAKSGYGSMGKAYAESAGPTSIKIGWEKVDWAAEYKIERRVGATGSFNVLKTVGAGTTFITDTGLTTGTTYYYQVSASNGKKGADAYTTSPSAVVSAAPSSAGGSTALAQVSGVKADPASATSVTVSWTAVTGAGGYEVYRSTSSSGSYTMVQNITSGSTRTYTNTGLESGATYWYKVRAWRAATGGTEYGAYSSSVSAKPTPNMPDQVGGVKAESVNDSTIKISWTAVSGATRYEVHRSTNSGGGYTNVGTVTGASSTSFSDYSLKTGTRYYYKVRACTVVGFAATYGNFSAVVYAVPTLEQVESVKALNYGNNTLSIEWRIVYSASGYEIHRSTSSAGTYTLAGTTVGYNKTDFISGGLTNGTQYWFKVRAYCLVGSSKVYGGFSAAAAGTPSANVEPSSVAVRYLYGTATGSYTMTGAGNFSMPLTTPNATCTLAAIITPSGANINNTVAWSSSETTVATVSSTGVVTARGVGTTYITAATGPSYSITSNSMAITVKPAVTSMSFSADSVDYKVGTEVSLQNPLIFTPVASGVYPGAYDHVEYTSSNPSLAEFGEKSWSTGTYKTIKAKVAGAVIVTATSHNNRTAIYTAYLKPPLTNAVFAVSTKALALKEKWDPVIDLTPDGGYQDYELVSSDTKVAHIENNKTVVALTSGKATISLKLNDKVMSTCVVTVTGTGTGTPPSDPPPGSGGLGTLEMKYESSDCQGEGLAKLTICLTKLADGATYYVVTQHGSEADALAGVNVLGTRSWQVLASNASKPISMNHWMTGTRYICVTAFSSSPGNYSLATPLAGTKIARVGGTIAVLYHPMCVGDNNYTSKDSYLLASAYWGPYSLIPGIPYALMLRFDPIPEAAGYEIRVWSALRNGQTTYRGTYTVTQPASGRAAWASGEPEYSNYNGFTTVQIIPFIIDGRGERVYGNYRELLFRVHGFMRDWNSSTFQGKFYDYDLRSAQLFFDYN